MRFLSIKISWKLDIFTVVDENTTLPTDIEVSSKGVKTGIYSVYVVTQLSSVYYYSYRSCSGTTDNYSYCGSSGDCGSNWIQKT